MTVNFLTRYSWPEPTALQSTTDPNQTVRLHCLCPVCQRLVDEFSKLGMSEDRWHDLSGTSEFEATEIKHYRSTFELAASSERGCHLCSILWARLQAETSTLESLRLLESRLQTAFMRLLDMVPHSYAIRVYLDQYDDGEAYLILYYPPKYHGFGESEELCSLFESCLTSTDSRDIAIKMNRIPCSCIPFED